MSTIGQFSAKNPTIKRILKEASELSSSPSADYTAAPLETNLFEWHFTIRGPPAPSPFDGGVYHGRIILPPAYPLRPPSFRFLTPSGRFEVNREICLSISGFHEETWQPAWGIRTAIIAIRSFMDTDAQGQMGGLSQPEETRRKLAKDSAAWRCFGCTGKTCAEMIADAEDAAREAGGDRTEESVPDELRLGYREDIEKKPTAEASGTASNNKLAAAFQQNAQEGASLSQAPDAAASSSSRPASQGNVRQRMSPAASNSFTSTQSTRPAPTPTIAARRPPPPAETNRVALLDRAIWIVSGGLIYYAVRIVARRLGYF